MKAQRVTREQCRIGYVIDDPTISVSSLSAWRVWHVGNDSDTDVTIWEPHKPLEANHIYPPNSDDFPRCPGSPCSGDFFYYAILGGHYGCGIYGHKTIEQMHSERTNKMVWTIDRFPAICIGEVSLYGRIVEHEHGYRAQFGYPKRIIYGQGCNPDTIAKIYGIPYEEDGSLWKSAFPLESSPLNLGNRLVSSPLQLRGRPRS